MKGKMFKIILVASMTAICSISCTRDTEVEITTQATATTRVEKFGDFERIGYICGVVARCHDKKQTNHEKDR